jgi:hypothetical protein
MYGVLPFQPGCKRNGPSGDRQRNGRSSSHRRVGCGIGFKNLTEAGAELAVEDGAADLEQEIGAAAGPAADRSGQS